MYKKSFYNLPIFKSDDVLVLYNANTGGFGEIVNNNIEFYMENELFDETETQTNEKTKLISTMKEHGFLVESDSDEIQIRDVITKSIRYSNKAFGLTIAPTLNCNMACPYCYEKKKDTIMSYAIQENLLSFIESKYKSNNFNNFNISWYGGEPTLVLDVIEKISEKVIGFCVENKIEYSSGIVTNGLLLDVDCANRLKKCGINNAQITIDGLEDVHNSRRVTVDQINGFEKIINNIKAIRGIINISIRVNVDQTNVEECKKIIDFFISNDFYKDGISFYFAPVSPEIGECVYEHKCYSKEQFGVIESELIKYISIIENDKQINILFPPRLAKSMCGFTSPNAYVCGPKGELYKCWNDIGQESKTVGNVKDGVIMNTQNLKWLKYELKETCKNCININLCNGGCPYEVMEGIDSDCSFKIVSLKPLLLAHYNKFVRNNAIDSNL